MMAAKLATLIVIVLLFPLVSNATKPAFIVVPEKKATGSRLFDFETIQLTDDVIKRLDGATESQISKISRLVAFYNSFDIDDGKTRPGECKAFPGDADWPDNEVWDEFNSLLGGALISTVPIAAPCYDSEWGPKDMTKCNDVISKFGTPPLQYVRASSTWLGLF